MMTGRINFRLTDEQERALRQAAALTGQTVTGFVLSTAVEHAHEVLERANRIASRRRSSGGLSLTSTSLLRRCQSW